MNLPTSPYLQQVHEWPEEGKHILASYDDRTIVVYQAYRPAIGEYAIRNGHLGGPDFSYSRMSWIKPNFLWMMYRSGWGSKEGQEITLGLRIGRPFFDRILGLAVASTYYPDRHPTHEAWQQALTDSDVRLQWDPDHDPHGVKQARRAVQLGLRGAVLEAFGKAELIEVIDMTAFVAEQRQRVEARDLQSLHTPREQIYVHAMSN